MTWKVTGKIVAMVETEYMDEDFMSEHGIADVIAMYAVTDIGGTTVDVGADLIALVPMHFVEATEQQRDDALDRLHDMAVRSEPEYLMRADITNSDPRFTVPVTLELDDDEEVADPRDSLRDYMMSGAAEEPEILNYGTWAAWRAEHRAKRRARNLPPIANWGANGLVNLPLFVATANREYAAHRGGYERLDRIHGGCAASGVFKARLKAMGIHWNL